YVVLGLARWVWVWAWRGGLLHPPPDDRRLHREPMPRLGGIAIFAAIVIPAAALGNQHRFWGGVVGAALMTEPGAYDDIRPLNPLMKLSGQVAIAVVTVYFGVA